VGFWRSSLVRHEPFDQFGVEVLIYLS